ncbi:hypothetical protein FJTKL_04925 [Diaporthe vaccinii]|uniref:Chromo domain-containing protein n=1 Tax=Diaporthe vaccinii TaxID=105482 RepID=A0ABR4DRU3_9PEZI
MASNGPDTPMHLTSYNLMRLGRGSSLTPSWEPTNASQFLSSGASSSRRPVDYRIEHTKAQVRFYIDQLLQIKPDGEQVVLRAEVQGEGRDGVSLKTSAPDRPIPWDDNVEVLAFWKRQRYHLKEQLFQVTKKRFGTPPVTPTLSEIQEDCRMSAKWTERWPVLQYEVETWLRNIPPGRKAVKARHAASRRTMEVPPRRSRRLAQLPPELRPLAPKRRRGVLRS